MSCRKVVNSELSKHCFNSTIPVQWLCVMLYSGLLPARVLSWLVGHQTIDQRTRPCRGSNSKFAQAQLHLLIKYSKFQSYDYLHLIGSIEIPVDNTITKVMPDISLSPIQNKSGVKVCVYETRSYYHNIIYYTMNCSVLKLWIVILSTNCKFLPVACIASSRVGVSII